MRPPRLPALLALAAAALLASGCKGSCRQLSEKLCECAETTIERESCLRNASTTEASLGTSADDEAICAELLPRCDCHAIDTAEGKKACGLAR